MKITFQIKEPPIKYHWHLGKGSTEKNVFFALPELPKPPPPWPEFGPLNPLFSEGEIQNLNEAQRFL